MKSLGLVLLFLMTVACSSGPSRKIASHPAPIVGPISLKTSKIFFYPPEANGHVNQKTFYIEIRDKNRNMVDANPNEFQLKTRSKKIQTIVERLHKGKYLLTLTGEESNQLKSVNFTIRGKTLSYSFPKLHLPSRSNCSVKIVDRGDHILKLQIQILDGKNRAVELQNLPDLMLEGSAELQGLQMVRKGVWEVELEYPDMNQIIYLSIRANGILLDRIFRYQHIEK